MRSTNLNDTELLSQAHAREMELRDSWRTANYRPTKSKSTSRGTRAILPRAARAAAGRVLIRFGRRVLPAGIEPCM